MSCPVLRCNLPPAVPVHSPLTFQLPDRLRNHNRRYRSGIQRTTTTFALKATRMEDSYAAESADQLGNLLIVGAGVLGTYLGKLWVDHGGTAFGETKTDQTHGRLKSVGIIPCTVHDRTEQDFPLVVFCVPPSASANYVGNIRTALGRWNGAGIFIFTSSTGVYAPSEGQLTETSPVYEIGANQRMDRVVLSEQLVLERGGCVVRLAGLYHSLRGPHSFFFSKGECPRPPLQQLNLIHYQDAASLIFQVLLQGNRFKRKILLAMDEEPVSFEDLLESSKESGLYQGDVKVTGDRSISGPSKLLNNHHTLELLGDSWSPSFSFQRLMKSGGNDWYKNSKLWV